MNIKGLKKIIKRFKRTVSAGMMAFTVFFMSNVPVYADDVQNSKIVKGTEKLIGDVTTWLMVLAPVVSGLLIIYFFIRRSAADEMDQKKCCARKCA